MGGNDVVRKLVALEVLEAFTKPLNVNSDWIAKPIMLGGFHESVGSFQ